MVRSKIEIDPITINHLKVDVVIIDQHYRQRHDNHMNDNIIIQLIQQLDGKIELPETVDQDGYAYFTNLVRLHGKQYRLIWLLEDGQSYIGVVNAFRDRRRS